MLARSRNPFRPRLDINPVERSLCRGMRSRRNDSDNGRRHRLYELFNSGGLGR